MTIKNDICYFSSFPVARAVAQANNLPTDRIIAYELGWAIQLRVSGYYAGPSNIGHIPF